MHEKEIKQQDTRFTHKMKGKKGYKMMTLRAEEYRWKRAAGGNTNCLFSSMDQKTLNVWTSNSSSKSRPE